VSAGRKTPSGQKDGGNALRHGGIDGLASGWCCG
jgi:hypothetical protein